jgi:hypothetical protein
MGSLMPVLGLKPPRSRKRLAAVKEKRVETAMFRPFLIPG